MINKKETSKAQQAFLNGLLPDANGNQTIHVCGAARSPTEKKCASGDIACVIGVAVSLAGFIPLIPGLDIVTSNPAEVFMVGADPDTTEKETDKIKIARKMNQDKQP